MKLIIASLVAVFTGGIALLGVGGGAAMSQVPEASPAAVARGAVADELPSTAAVAQAGAVAHDAPPAAEVEPAATAKEAPPAPPSTPEPLGTPRGAIIVPGADGSDGPLTYTGGSWLLIDLGKAPTAAWDSPGGDVDGDGRGDGVYDPNIWAVVFKYSSVDVSFVYFKNHPSGAPVIWLVSGNVRIRYSVQLYGQADNDCTDFTTPGPGGFRGARGAGGALDSSGGFGPGGGEYSGTLNLGMGGAGHAQPGGRWTSNQPGLQAAPAYGNAYCLPLIGGSGGGGWPGCTYSGGSGGGAILIAAQGQIQLDWGDGSYQTIAAQGRGNGDSGGGGGSGGTIKLIADSVIGNGYLYAGGGDGYSTANGSVGRIFINTNYLNLTKPTWPEYTPVLGVTEAQVVPPPTTPTVRAAKLVVDGNDVPIPADPRARLDIPMADILIDTVNPTTLHIEARNVPLDWIVVARVVPKDGATFSVTAAPLSGTVEYSTTTAELNLPRKIGAIQVRAYQPAP